MEKFESNLNAAKESCEKMYKYIKSSSFACDGMHLKFKDLYTFDALFVIPEADWCRDEFDSIYEKADEIIDAVKQETFMLSLIFMPKTSEMNMLAIRSDGFRFSYLPSK